jgi:hypothetical protein
MATWQPAADAKSEIDWHIQTDWLVTPKGERIACVVEMIDERYYPHAFDVEQKMWVRGGCFDDPIKAQRWCEILSGERARP